MHVEFCREFGISKEDLDGAEEALGKSTPIFSSHLPRGPTRPLTTARTACTAYSRYILEVGQSEDWMGLQIALAPCILGYGEIARRLHADSRTKRAGNPYWAWIGNYVADDYVQATEKFSGEAHRQSQPASRLPNRNSC